MKRLERIVRELGGDVYDGGRRALVPGPDHGEADRSVSLLETDDGRIIIHCFSPRDDWRSVRNHLIAHGLLDGSSRTPGGGERTPRPRLVGAQPRNEARVARARRLWAEGRPIFATPAQRHLRLRGIAALPEGDDTLRFHPRMTSLDDRHRRPALMAALRNAAGEVQGIEVTLLSAHGGGKAVLPTPRRVIGELMGGAVQLFAPSETLAIAEGTATALSAHDELGVPAWAALTAGNLAAFTPPPSVKRLIVAHDNDVASRHAVWKLATRLCGAIRIEAAPPPEQVNDWNDQAQAAAAKPA